MKILTAKIFFVCILLYNYSFAQNENVSTTLLALGDVNLGRVVGQKILKGEIDYPFEKFQDVLSRADIIFANLESQVTDQKGETQSPKSNIVFCAPPEAAKTLKRANISIVSTANNHAYDYGLKGLRETIKFLNEEKVPFVGIRSDTNAKFESVVIEKNDIKIGFVAYTQILNIRSKWDGLISFFDSVRAYNEINDLKTKADFVVASYHGGDEYKDKPGSNAERDMRLLAEFGADIVFGHHPHVPNGIEIYQNNVIFHSLGNAVFNQPQRYWTQRSFAPLIKLEKRNGRKVITSIEIIPFRPGFQINTDLSLENINELIARIQLLSTVSIIQNERGYFVHLPNNKIDQ